LDYGYDWTLFSTQKIIETNRLRIKIEKKGEYLTDFADDLSHLHLDGDSSEAKKVQFKDCLE
jgi:hypothetical protein